MSPLASPAPSGYKPDSLPPSPVWLRGCGRLGGHVQTIWTALYAQTYQGTPPIYRRERWTTPDYDFIDVDWLDTPQLQPSPLAPFPASTSKSLTHLPLMVLFHGLEGSSQSPYALAMAHWCQQNGWAYAVPHFRSCSGSINRAPRLYHMGDYKEADWILKRIRQIHTGPIAAIGVSLGGNVLLRWAIETATQAAQSVSAIACICAPLDLNINAQQMDNGFCKWVYTNIFLRTMRQKAKYKIKQYPGLFDIHAVLKARTFAQFDEALTAPLHGFKGCVDYWTRSSIEHTSLHRIQIPALLLNPLNDPFIPAYSLPPPQSSHINSYLSFLRPHTGGHLGFASGRFPGSMEAFAASIGQYLQQHL